MAGPVSYPDNAMTRIAALEQIVNRLIYASQAHEPYTRLIARGMLVGNDSPGRRILFNPDGANPHSAEIWMFPYGASEDNPAKIVVDESASYPNQAVLTLQSGASATALARLRQASGEIFMQVLDETGTADNGGYAYWGESHAQFGYLNGSGDNYFNFSSTSLSRHFGAWDDFGSQPSNSGLLWGSLTTPSGNSHTISYPATMDSNMGPIIGFRPANSSPLISWQITASNTSSMSLAWSGTAQSAGVYMVSFRH